MLNYFANNNHFAPHKNNPDIPVIDSMTGVLISCETKPGKNSSGSWIVVRLRIDNDYANLYFDSSNIEPQTLDNIVYFHNRRINVQCSKGKPIIAVVEDADSEMTIRAELLKGVASGNIKTDELPALMGFLKGEYDLFEQWMLFKKKIENDNLAKVQEDLTGEASKLQDSISQVKNELKEMEDVHEVVKRERDALLKELNSTLMILQGEDSLQGSHFNSIAAHYSDELVSVENSYHGLIDSLQKAGSRKGIYVICGNTIHRIHHLFLESKGRAYLLGTEQEFNKTNPKKVKEIIDKISEMQNRTKSFKEYLL